jgi:hypothetical protein
VVNVLRRAKLGGMTGFRSSAAALAFSTALFAFSPHAFGFCRTITQAIPADFPQTLQCYDPPGAIPLWWSGQCVGFSIQQNASTQISLADAEAHAASAFGRWSGATCPNGGSPSIAVSDEGPVACDLVRYSEIGPNQHAIIFRDTSWPYDDPYNTLALTSVTFDTDTGEIYDADMEVNTFKTQVVIGKTPGPNQYDLDTILTHETGHFLGLAHTPLESAVMFAQYTADSSVLSSDDIAGICAIYAPGGARAHEVDASAQLVAVTTQESATCDPTPRHGFGSACGPLGSAEVTTKGCSIGSTAATATTTAGGAWATVALFGAALGLGIARRRRAARIVRMRRFRSVALGCVLAFGAVTGAAVLAAHDAQASIAITVLFDELVRDSSAAAIVTPYDQKTVWEDGRIITYTHVHADRSVAGTLESDPWIRTMGGSIGKIGQLVDGEPVLTVGRPGLLFVRPVPDSGGGIYAVTARAQGQFPVVLQDRDGQKNVATFRSSSAVGGLVAPPAARIAEMSQLRGKAGLAAEAPRAIDVLHTRPVEDGVRDVAAAWARIHGPGVAH